MKTVTIQVSTQAGYEGEGTNRKARRVLTSIQAYPTPCPYLFAHKVYKTYRLTQTPTGLYLLDNIHTLKEAKEYARRINEVADLSRPIWEMSQNTAMMDIIREHRRQR